ncbi:DUF1552 domain-containing protein [Nannocystaceae bacterium ST9]
MRKHLERRTFLRGLVGGSLASIALPPLDAMMNLTQTAFADGTDMPVRYVSWFWGNGIVPDKWEPTGVGPNWQLSPHLMPLAAHKDYLNVVTGLDNRATQLITHHEGMTVWSGYTMADVGQGPGFFSNTAGPTIDHLISELTKDKVAISGIHTGVSKAQSPADFGTTMHSLSSRGYLQPNSAITSPSAVWQALFGSFVQPKDDRALRISILDATKQDAATLESKLGAADKLRLEAHLESIAALQTKLSTAIPVCELPADPDVDNSEPINSEMLTLVHGLHADLIAYAFACDITRVATLLFIEGAAEPALTEIPNNVSSWHQYSHDVSTWNLNGPFYDGQLFLMSRIADFLDRLKSTNEIDGNLLDSTILMASSDCSHGPSHAVTRHPILLAGHGRGYLKYPGVHFQPAPLDANYDYYNVPGPSSGNTSDVLLALLRRFDPRAEWIGEEQGAGSGTPLTEILA